MTYCVGLSLDAGLMFMSDTRTNAGVDNISVFRKTKAWVTPGERVLVLMSAGNLATSQSVVSLLDERNRAAGDREAALMGQPSMFQTATLVGRTLSEVIARTTLAAGPKAETSFGASFILGGQIKGGPPRLFLIYPEGNFIEATQDTPFFQIGETKYGKPIIVRAYDPALSFAEAGRLLLVSFDSTLKANLSVGLPLDMTIYRRDSFTLDPPTRIEADNPYYRSVTQGWSAALQATLDALPPMPVEQMAAAQPLTREPHLPTGERTDACDPPHGGLSAPHDPA